MIGQGVVFTEPKHAELEQFELPEALEGTEVQVRTEASLISPGTELSYFTGVMDSAPRIYADVPPFEGAQASPEGTVYPARTGYANIGRVERVGDSVDPALLGRRVFTMSRHASHVVADVDFLVVPAPDTIEPAHAAFARLAGVGATALRAAHASAGDRVAVIGLGLVGNLTAQLFALAGCEVIGFDVDAGRRELAEKCGIGAVEDPTERDPVAVVRRWGGGGAAAGADIVVEATGRAQQVIQAVEMTGRYGAAVLLGSPRVAATMEVTDAFARAHWLSLQILGGSEWGFPVRSATPRARFSLERNYAHILRWIADRSLHVAPLITHSMQPEECQTAYTGLLEEPRSHVGVVFDWNSGAAESAG